MSVCHASRLLAMQVVVKLLRSSNPLHMSQSKLLEIPLSNPYRSPLYVYVCEYVYITPIRNVNYSCSQNYGPLLVVDYITAADISWY